MPRTDPTKLGRRKHSAPAETDNLYFYADLEKYRPEELASAVAHRYEGVTGYDPARHRSHVDLASQIIINSRIIMAKNRAFRTAAWFALAALASAVVSASLSLIFCR